MPILTREVYLNTVVEYQTMAGVCIMARMADLTLPWGREYSAHSNSMSSIAIGCYVQKSEINILSKSFCPLSKLEKQRLKPKYVAYQFQWDICCK
jgi:hypothetical protein